MNLWCRIVALGLVLGVLSTSGSAWAQAVDIQGVGNLESKSSTLKPAEQDQLKRLALVSAISRLSASFSTAKTTLYAAKKAEIEADIASYFADVKVVDQSYDKATKTHSLVIRGTINQAKLDAALSGAPAGAVANGANQIAISFLFVARDASSVKQFETRKTRVAEVKASGTSAESLTASQQSGLNGDQASVSEQTQKEVNVQATAVATTGGSNLKQADKVEYAVSSPENINAAMLDVFTSGGFEVYDYKDVAGNCSGRDPSQIYPEFATSDELSADTRKAVFTAARSCEVNAFAIGTLDVGIQDVDPATGNKRVFVSVRSQVYSLAGKLPRAIASAGPVQFAGLGPDQAVASKNALQLAAKEVATSIAAQLRARGL